jgi:hypothetical protein
MDCCVLTWVYCTVSNDLQQALMIRDPTARDAWLYLEDEFLGQRESRALLMEAEFRSFKQGALSITDYCRRLETMAASLKEFGDPIDDWQLVLTLLRGLNDKYRHMVSNLKMQRSFPTFLRPAPCCSLRNSTSTTSATTLLPTPSLAHRPWSCTSNRSSSGTPPRPLALVLPPVGLAATEGTATAVADAVEMAATGATMVTRVPGTLGLVHALIPPLGYGNLWSGCVQMWPHGYSVFPGHMPRPPLDQQPQPGLHMMPTSTPGFSYGGASTPGFGYGCGPPTTLPLSAGMLLHAPWNPMAGESWDQASLTSNFNMTPPNSVEWYADSSAGSHMTAHSGILSSPRPPSLSGPSSIIVGNGSLLPITSIGSYSFTTPRRSLVLNDVLVSPSIIKNLIFVRRFTIDNNCSIEFDPFGLSVKDLQTRNVIARCNSTGDLYPFFLPITSSTHALAVTSTLWHRRLGHISFDALSKLISSQAITCNKPKHDHLCHACQLGRHVRLPFGLSTTRVVNRFDLIHCDLWTSPVVSVSGYKYYLVIIDDYSHYTWTFPRRLKSDTFTTISNFFAHVRT